MADKQPESQDPQPRKRNIVVGKAQGEWGDTLPAATIDEPVVTDEHEAARTATTHPPIIGIEEMPPDQDALRH
jgi:hypothetical protein